MMMTFSSCAVPAEAQIATTSSPSVEVIISSGIPYYIDNAIVYWYYQGSYWYPYYSNGHRYLRPYVRPMRHHHVARPHHHNPNIGPHHPHHPRPSMSSRPSHRPSPQMRPHSPQNRPHGGHFGGHGGHFGGRR